MRETLERADGEAVDAINYLTQSPVRVSILHQLDNVDCLSKAELRDRFDVSRVTVQRNLDALEERGWITSSSREYEIRPLGELVAAEIAATLETVDLVERLRPFLRWFPESALEFDVRALADATVVASDSTDPYAPVNRHIEAMESASRFRCLLPAVGLPAMTVARDCLERGQHQEVVFTPAIESTLRTESEYRDLAAELADNENCTLLVADREITYYLGLFDDQIQIGVEDEDGIPRALLETDADVIREWGEQTYESYLEGADSFVF